MDPIPAEQSVQETEPVVEPFTFGIRHLLWVMTILAVALTGFSLGGWAFLVSLFLIPLLGIVYSLTQAARQNVPELYQKAFMWSVILIVTYPSLLMVLMVFEEIGVFSYPSERSLRALATTQFLFAAQFISLAGCFIYLGARNYRPRRSLLMAVANSVPLLLFILWAWR